MRYYIRNLQFLKQYGAALYQKIKDEDPLISSLQVEETGKGLKLIDTGISCYLHSVYDKEQEYAWLFREIDKNVATIVFFGMGDLKYFPYLVKHFKKLKTVILIEPTLQIMEKVLEQVDLQKELAVTQGVRIIFTVNFLMNEIVHDAAQYLKGEPYAVVAFPSYRNIFSALYQEFMQKFTDQVRMLYSALANMTGGYQLLCLDNILRNKAVKSLPIECIIPLIEGRPVILVGAGPSLEKNMRYLQEASRKAIIIAAGKAVQILSRAGIRPHFNAGVDATDIDYFDNQAYPDIPLLFTQQFSPEIIQRYKGGPLLNYLLNMDPISSYSYMNAEQRDFTVFCGASIINCMHDFVCRAHASKVIFIGQDMCMYESRLYANAGEWKLDNVNPVIGDLIEKDIYGETVRTVHSYYTIKMGLEQVRTLYPDIPHVNATEGGLGVAGVGNQNLKSVLAELPAFEDSMETKIRSNLRALKDSTLSYTLQDCFDRLHVRDGLKHVRISIEQLKNLLHELEDLQAAHVKAIRLDKKIEQICRVEKKMFKQAFFLWSIGAYVGDTSRILHSRYEQGIVSEKIKERVAARLYYHWGKLNRVEEIYQYFEKHLSLESGENHGE